MSSSGLNSPTCCGNSPSGINFAPGILQILYSCGSRTSINVNLSPRSIFCFEFDHIDFAFVQLGPPDRRRLIRGRHAAELMVIDQLGNRRMLAANRALRILAQLEFAELHPQRVVEQQPSRPANRRCRGSASPSRSPESIRWFPAGCPARRLRRSSEPGPEAAVRDRGSDSTGRPRSEDRGLSFEAEDRAVDVRLAQASRRRR